MASLAKQCSLLLLCRHRLPVCQRLRLGGGERSESQLMPGASSWRERWGMVVRAASTFKSADCSHSSEMHTQENAAKEGRIIFEGRTSPPFLFFRIRLCTLKVQLKKWQFKTQSHGDPEMLTCSLKASILTCPPCHASVCRADLLTSQEWTTTE